MENGKWKMENGELKMKMKNEKCEWRISNPNLPVVILHSSFFIFHSYNP